MDKGDTKTLNVTKEAQHRIVVGLGWDPAADPGLVKKVKAIAKRKAMHHDLDLSCYAFDVNKSLCGHVSALPELASMADEKIYHSGDNEEGIGDGDDEEISAELKDMPDNIHSMIFTATVTSGQLFGAVNSPEMRIADGYTDHNFLECKLARDVGKDANVFVFIKLSRDGENWTMTYINEYAKDSEISDYEEHLRTFL